MDVDVVQLVRDGGVIGLLLAILVGGVKRWWVFGWAYRNVEQEKQYWMQMALKSTDLAHDAAELAEKVARS